MGKILAHLLPVSTIRLAQFGERLRLARLRRRLTAKQIAERAGITTVTLRSLESGKPSVAMGSYLAVLNALGMDADLDLLAGDPMGQHIQDAHLSHTQSRRAADSALIHDNPSTPQAVPEAATNFGVDDMAADDGEVLRPENLVQWLVLDEKPTGNQASPGKT